MNFQQLPPEILNILATLNAPPRLIAHLEVVHDTALMLIHNLSETWPDLDFDKQSVLFGAATHDIGKALYTGELVDQGTHHEEVGPQLLRDFDFPEKYARFARTHARWQQEPVIQLEDVLVAFADTIWKGKRDAELEQEIAQQIAGRTQEEVWDVYMKLDDIANELAVDAHGRILWQGNYPV
jgi:putative nucleotidyltransferase with HDIG domain